MLTRSHRRVSQRRAANLRAYLLTKQTLSNAQRECLRRLEGPPASWNSFRAWQHAIALRKRVYQAVKGWRQFLYWTGE